MRYWLMKAEPDSRVVKGKDVKFSVDDFEAAKTTPWEGVRNAEARNLMREMRIGDKVLFYHSNCKTPGVAGFAEVTKEAYPDLIETPHGIQHPYYDLKTDKDKPKWYMVEVTFSKRAIHFVSLHLLKRIASSPEVPEGIDYIGEDGVEAIKGMALINRGRLSVQPVDEKTWDAIVKLAGTGGWDDNLVKASKGAKKRTQKVGVADNGDDGDEAEDSGKKRGAKTSSKKRKTSADNVQDERNVRRSTRLKT